MVDNDVLAITCPPDRKGLEFKGRKVVASAEQSYLQLMKEGKLPEGKYVATTPCFRDEPTVDELHQFYFLKTELIEVGYHSATPPDENLENMIHDAVSFFEQFLSVRVERTAIGKDIVDVERGVELGSYGIRTHQFSPDCTAQWIYGTGVALPRLSYVLSTQKKGYHDRIIPKAKAGSFFKMVEEMEEATDAYLSQNPIMLLVEPSDFYGAMELFLEQHLPGVSMDDVKRMQQVTARAFKNKVRR